MSDLLYEDFADVSTPFILDTSRIMQLLSCVYGDSYQDIVRNLGSLTNPYEKERHLHFLFANHFSEIVTHDVQHHLYEVVTQIWIRQYDQPEIREYLDKLFRPKHIKDIFEKMQTKSSESTDKLDHFQWFKQYIYSLVEKKIKKHFI